MAFIGNPNVDIEKIKQLSHAELIYTPITDYGKCSCIAHEGKDCFSVARQYETKRASSVPSSVHTMRTINDVFIEIYDALVKGEPAIPIFETEEIKSEIERIENLIEKFA